MTYQQKEAAKFAAKIKALGFKVFVAERGTYGYITDDAETRVLSWSVNDGGRLGGNYGPPSIRSGTGWSLDESMSDLKTAEDVREALNAMPPSWCGNGWHYVSTVAQYRALYQSSSRFAEA